MMTDYDVRFFGKFNDWREVVDNDAANIRFRECIGAMKDMFDKDSYLPVQHVFYLTFERIDDKTYAVIKGKIVNAYLMSLNELYHKILKEDLMAIPGFVGLLSKEFGIGYYLDQLKALYPEEDIVLNVSFVDYLKSQAGMRPAASEDSEEIL